MSVYIYDKDAFDKMVEVEGPNYVEFQDNIEPCSFGAFLNAWRSIPEEVKESAPEWGVSVNGIGAIYGLYGWNRYTVRYSGEICFIELMAGRREDIEKARTVGFTIV